MGYSCQEPKQLKVTDNKGKQKYIKCSAWLLTRGTVAVENELTIVEQSPNVVEVKSPCPLPCVSHTHGIDTHYQWNFIPENERVFADA